MRTKPKIKFTYQDYLQLPEDKRYELIEGELYMVPSPGTYHQHISRNLGFILWPFIRERDLGVLFNAPLDVVLSEENVVQPDLLFVAKGRLSIITEQNVRGAPDLVIEVLSPATAERDLGIKTKLYAKYGVEEYWIVDPQKRTVEVLALGEEGYNSIGVYDEHSPLKSPLLEGLLVNLKEVF